MRTPGRVAVAGAVLMLAAACSDDGRSGAPPVTPTTTSPPVGSADALGAHLETTTSTTAAPTITSVPATAATTATIPATTASPRVSFPDDLSAIAGIAATFTSPGSPIGPDVARCIGDGLVHVFGRPRVEQLGFGIGRWTLLGFSIALGPWNRPDSTAVVDTFRVCTPDWELLMITSATSTAEHIDALAGRCVAGALDDTRGRDVFITLLDHPDDGTLAPAVDDLERAYAACLTPEQLSSLALQVEG
jgi:hypothetical protein